MIRLKRKLNESAPDQLLIIKDGTLKKEEDFEEEDFQSAQKKHRISPSPENDGPIVYARVEKKSSHNHLDSVLDKYANLLREYKLSSGLEDLSDSRRDQATLLDYVYEYYEPCKSSSTSTSTLNAEKTRIVKYADLLLNTENECDDIQFWYEDIDGDHAEEHSDYHDSTDSNAEDFYGNDYPDTDSGVDEDLFEHEDSADSEVTGSDLDLRFEYGNDFDKEDYCDYYSSDYNDYDEVESYR